MGIDFHGLHFLNYCCSNKPFGRTVTLGRQSLTMAKYFLQYGTFCEQLLKDRFGASEVQSYDASGYEGATHIADFNLPIQGEQYDTVIDCGTLEHVFDIAQALRNVSALCSVGGQIIHVSPASNFCGHGFWQISPEMFFSLYSERRGFTGTEVFMADLKNHSYWFKVKPPSDGNRVEVRSSNPLYIMCRTHKQRASDAPVQQSDYVDAWQSNPASSSRLSLWLRKRPWLFRLAYSMRVALSSFRRQFHIRLNSRNPDLLRVRIPTIDGRGTVAHPFNLYAKMLGLWKP